MNLRQITGYIAEYGLPIKTEFYDDAGSLCAAIREYRKDPDGFIKVQKVTETKKGPKLEKQNEVDRMLELYGDGYAVGTGKLEPKVIKAKKSAEVDEDELVGV